MGFRASLEGRGFLLLTCGLLLLASPGAQAERYRYEWNGPTFTTASGNVSTADSVSGYLVLEGPVENLPFATVTPVAFSFSSALVTIDDTTPLHAFTTVKLQTDANGDVIAAEIQWVEGIDTGDGTPFPGDVICVASCQAANQDLVIDRNVLGAVLGTGEVPIVDSFWTSATLLAQGVPALPWPLLTLGLPIVMSVRRRLRP